jgi:hypothetical protein
MPVTVPVPIPVSLPIPITVHVFVPGYLVRWTEEAGCEAHGILKRWVVKIMRNLSLGERIDGN